MASTFLWTLFLLFSVNIFNSVHLFYVSIIVFKGVIHHFKIWAWENNKPCMKSRVHALERGLYLHPKDSFDQDSVTALSRRLSQESHYRNITDCKACSHAQTHLYKAQSQDSCGYIFLLGSYLLLTSVPLSFTLHTRWCSVRQLFCSLMLIFKRK